MAEALNSKRFPGSAFNGITQIDAFHRDGTTENTRLEMGQFAVLKTAFHSTDPFTHSSVYYAFSNEMVLPLVSEKKIPSGNQRSA